MTILYPVYHNLYVNMTNRCPCACTFCLRQHGDSVYGSDPLWLEREPTVEEVIAAFSNWDLTQFEEIVFCGYGEPTERLDDLLEVARFLKEKHHKKIRINTNGMADLIAGEPTAHKLEGLVDTVSISLNSPNEEEYLRTVRPKFGKGSYQAMLRYAADCKAYVPHVVMTIVDVVTTKEEQQRCQEICDSLGVSLRIRPYEE